MQRGVIRNPEYAKQLKDFSGLSFGTITPTDVDGMIEYRNKGFIFFESKYGGAEMPEGQRLALERLVEDHKKPAILFSCVHNTPSSEVIDFAKIIVKKYYFKGEWYVLKDGVTLYDAIWKFIKELCGHGEGDWWFFGGIL